MYLARRMKLYCSPKASAYLFGAAGARRYAWNWSVAESKRAWEEEKKTLTEYDLVKRFNAVKKELCPWMLGYSKWVPQLAASAFWAAQKRCLSSFKEKKKRVGFPKFKKKGMTKPSFQVAFPATRKVGPKSFRIPNCPHVFKISKPLDLEGKIMRTTFVREADGWYVSFLVDVCPGPYRHACESQAACGVDLGLKTFAKIVDSNREGYDLTFPDLSKLEARQRRAQQALSRKVKGSKNRWKAKERVALLSLKIARVRENFLHCSTSQLVSQYKNIAIEDLNVSGMAKNRALARAISRQGWREFRRQLEYKSALSGSTIVLADRFFPSSRLCSGCGWKNTELTLASRSWECPQCGSTLDRDANAAQNLLNLVAGRYPETLNACGEKVSPFAMSAKADMAKGISRRSKNSSKLLNASLQ